MKRLLDGLKMASIGLFSGLLGAFAGADGTSKAWRRFALPLSYLGLIWSNMSSWWNLTVLGMMGAFSLGYGIPDKTDGGSPIGQFWYQVFILYPKQRHLLADVLTRGTIGFLVGLSLIGLPIVRNNWIEYALGFLAIILIYSGLSWRDLGTFKFRGKTLLYSEMLVYTIIGIVTNILVR